MPVLLALAVLLAAIPVPKTAPVPKAMLGTWSDSGCSGKSGTRLIIGPKVARLAGAHPMPIVYYVDDDGAGHGAIHWREEGNVDNFVYVPATKRIVHNTQGYHMPGQIIYQRCSLKTN